LYYNILVSSHAATIFGSPLYYYIFVFPRAATIFGSPLWGGLAACGRLLIGQMPLAFDTVCGLPLCGPLFNLRRIGYTFFGATETFLLPRAVVAACCEQWREHVIGRQGQADYQSACPTKQRRSQIVLAYAPYCSRKCATVIIPR